MSTPADSGGSVAWLYEGPGGAIASEQLAEAYLLGQKVAPVTVTGEFAEAKAAQDRLERVAGVKLLSKPVNAVTEAYNVRAEDPAFALREGAAAARHAVISSALLRFQQDKQKRQLLGMHQPPPQSHPKHEGRGGTWDRSATDTAPDRSVGGGRDRDYGSDRHDHRRHHGHDHGDRRSRSRDRSDREHRKHGSERDRGHGTVGEHRDHSRHRARHHSRHHGGGEYERQDARRSRSRSWRPERRECDDVEAHEERSAARSRHGVERDPEPLRRDTLPECASAPAAPSAPAVAAAPLIVGKPGARYGLHQPLGAASTSVVGSSSPRLLGPSEAMIASRTAALAAAKLRALGGAALLVAAPAPELFGVPGGTSVGTAEPPLSREARLEAMRSAAASADAQRAAKAAASEAIGAAEAALSHERLRRTGGGGGDTFLAVTAVSMVAGGGQRVLDGARAAASARHGAGAGRGGDERLL